MSRGGGGGGVGCHVERNHADPENTDTGKDALSPSSPYRKSVQVTRLEYTPHLVCFPMLGCSGPRNTGRRVVAEYNSFARRSPSVHVFGGCPDESRRFDINAKRRMVRSRCPGQATSPLHPVRP